jgi:hypothetical protein
MTIKAWPFLVGLNKKLGYQTIVCPRFLSEAGLALLLAEAAGGDDSDPDSATCREILGSPVGDISLVFRVIKAKAQDYGLGGDEVLRDRSGRSIRLIEGFVVQGRKSVLRVSQNDLQITHEMVKGVYHDFWQAQTTFEEISLSPFELTAEDQGASRLELIKEKPLDLHSPLRKKIEPLIRPVLVALVALVVFVGGSAGIVIITQPTLARTLSTFCSDLSAAQPDYNDAYNQFSSGFQALYPPSSFAAFFGKHSFASCSYQQTGDNSTSAILSITYQDGVSVSIPINLQEEQHAWKITTNIVNALQKERT